VSLSLSPPPPLALLTVLRTIYRVKSSAPFSETSPMLYSVRSLSSFSLRRSLTDSPTD
jgi:hypothetical protein